MTPTPAPPHGPRPEGRHGTPALLIRLIINLAVPVLVYLLLRPHLASDITALVVGSAVPIAYTVGVMVWRRRLDAIGVFAIVCFAIGLLLVIATGGNELVFKLREEFWTGPLGLACLISVAVRQPLFFVALRLAERRKSQLAGRTADPQARRILNVTTAVVGVILLAHAMALVALALTTSTSTFLALKTPISLAIVGGGLAALVWWIRHQYTSRRNRPPATRLPGPQDPPGATDRPDQQKTMSPATTAARTAEEPIPRSTHTVVPNGPAAAHRRRPGGVRDTAGFRRGE